jgi:hypothetical protein
MHFQGCAHEQNVTYISPSLLSGSSATLPLIYGSISLQQDMPESLGLAQEKVEHANFKAN